MNGNFSIELIRLLHPLYFPTIKIMGKLNLFEEKNSKPFCFYVFIMKENILSLR